MVGQRPSPSRRFVYSDAVDSSGQPAVIKTFLHNELLIPVGVLREIVCSVSAGPHGSLRYGFGMRAREVNLKHFSLRVRDIRLNSQTGALQIACDPFDIGLDAFISDRSRTVLEWKVKIPGSQVLQVD
jgi:hypothetical protein